MEDFNKDEINNFFQFYQKNNFHLASLDPENNKFSRFNCHSLEKVQSYINRYNGEFNLYFLLNSPSNGSYKTESFDFLEKIMLDCDAGEDHTNKPATTEEIEELKQKLPKLEEELLKDGIKYDFIQFTGNGFQIILSIDPVKRIDYNQDAIKAYVSDLSKRTSIDFDSTFDLPRVARIPNTINIKGGRYSKIIKGSVFNNFKNNISKILEKYKLRSRHSEPNKKVQKKINDEFLFKRFNEIKSKDDKLKDLYSGNWKKHEYQSRSEAEFGLISKLIRYRFDQNSIRRIMDTCSIGKWQERENKYKDHQCRKAEEMYRASNSFMNNEGKIIEIDPNIHRCRIINKKIIKNVHTVHHFLHCGFETKKHIENCYRIQILESSMDSLDTIKNPSVRKQLKGKHYDKDVTVIIVEIEDFYDWDKRAKDFVPSQRKTCEFLLHNDNFVTFSDTDELYFYRGGVYKNTGEVFIKTLCNLIFPDLSPKFLDDVVKRIKSQTYIDRHTENDRYICLKNGIFDIKNKCLIEHTPNILFFNKLNVTYDENAKCPKFEQVLIDILPSDDITTLMEMFGYCFLKNYKYHKFFILKGDGRNGKSTVLYTLQTLLGATNFSSVSLQALSNDQFASSDLYGKDANIADDISADLVKSTGIIKMLTGWSPIRARRIYKAPFIFYNHAKLIFSCNQLPPTTDETGAFFGRYVPFNFNHKFNNTICPACGELHDTDPHLLDKITTDEELSGIFNIALEGMYRLIERGTFSITQSDDENKKQWQRDTNPFVAFKEDLLDETNSESFIFKKHMFSKYCDYCSEKKLSFVTYPTFCQRVNQHTKAESTKRKNSEGIREACWTGLKWKNESENETIENDEPEYPKIDEYDYEEEH